MSTKAELKENLLASRLEGAIKWIVDHRPAVLTAFGIIVVTALFASVFILQRSNQTKTDWTRLSQAQALMDMKRLDQSRGIFQSVYDTSPDLDAKLYAGFYLGQLDLQEKKYDEAITRFSAVVSNATDHPLRPLALSNLGFAYEEKGDFVNAVQTYRQFMTDHAEHFMAARVQLSLGRALAASNDIPSAKEELSRLIDLYPTSPWAERARQIIDKLKTR